MGARVHFSFRFGPESRRLFSDWPRGDQASGGFSGMRLGEPRSRSHASLSDAAFWIIPFGSRFGHPGIKGGPDLFQVSSRSGH